MASKEVVPAQYTFTLTQSEYESLWSVFRKVRDSGYKNEPVRFWEDEHTLATELFGRSWWENPPHA